MDGASGGGDGIRSRSRRAELRTLREGAWIALRHWSVDVLSIRLVQHEFNTTYRVESARGEQFALRIGGGSRRTEGQVATEVAWVRALLAESSVCVPEPMRTRDGHDVVQVSGSPLGRDATAVLYRWLPGRVVGISPSMRMVRAIGAAMAGLHLHATSWDPRCDAELASLGDAFMGAPDRMSTGHPLIGPTELAVLDDVRARVEAVLERLSRVRPIVIHGDLHGGNVKWHAGRPAVIDFDDCGLGFPVMDLAIAAYYLRDDERAETSLFDGYASVIPLPSFTPDDLETLVAGRNLVLLNEVIGHESAEMRELLPGYLRRSIFKLRAFLATGVYRHVVEGLPD
jgi:Ser/Thr protein kinase RdoA (MazF antagonist)